MATHLLTDKEMWIKRLTKELKDINKLFEKIKLEKTKEDK